MMRITFSKNSWEDYTSWQTEDKQILRKINELIKDIQRHPYEGLGKPEPLKYDLAGFWSRRIDLELIFRCNCATCFGDVVPQKKNDFMAKIITLFGFSSFCFFVVIRRLIQCGEKHKQSGLK